MPRTSLEIRFASRLARLRAPGAALVGVSGGADSVALLRLLVSGASPWPQLAVAHVNHGWRGAEADGDEAFVRALAAELALPFLARRVRTVDRREAAARQERLVAWREMARACGATTIVLAHTRDDQIETVALRLLRGSGVRGLRALLPVRQLPVAGGRGLLVARPLLATRRSELRAYLARLGQPFREDASNQDLRYARNALRHGVLPCWRERHAGLDHELLAIAAAADRVCRRSLRAAAAWRADVPPLWNGAAFRAAGDARFLLIAIQELAQRWRLPLERAACERLARWLARPHGAITLRGPCAASDAASSCSWESPG
ncbi:MAG: tRNA lysidine(34) synthetase TilS [Planctomycetota bacterium]